MACPKKVLLMVSACLIKEMLKQYARLLTCENSPINTLQTLHDFALLLVPTVTTTRALFERIRSWQSPLPLLK